MELFSIRIQRTFQLVSTKDRAFLNEIIKFMISSEDVKTDNNDDEEAESLD